MLRLEPGFLIKFCFSRVILINPVMEHQAHSPLTRHTLQCQGPVIFCISRISCEELLAKEPAQRDHVEIAQATCVRCISKALLTSRHNHSV